MSANFWPLSIPQAQQKGKVPGTSNWIAQILHDCNTEVLNNVDHIYKQFTLGVEEIDEFMKHAMDEQNVDQFIGSFQDIPSTTASNSITRVKRSLSSSPQIKSSPLVRRSGVTRSPRSSPLKNQVNNTGSIGVTASAGRSNYQQIIIPSTSPKSKPNDVALNPKQKNENLDTQEKKHSLPDNHAQESNDSDDSLHKIQMSIRRQTEVSLNTTTEKKGSVNNSYSTNNNSLNLPTKTPKRSSPAFVSLPPKEPLTINSSASHISRRSLALTKDRKESKKQSNEDNDYNNSPIRRNRFPSSIIQSYNAANEHELDDIKPRTKNSEESLISPNVKEEPENTPVVDANGISAKKVSIISKEGAKRFQEGPYSSEVNSKVSTTPLDSSAENSSSRPKNLFYNVMTPTAVHKAYSSSRMSPARRILSRTSKTPSKNVTSASRSSVSSLDTTKGLVSKSPTRYTEKSVKKSSIASKEDDTDTYPFLKTNISQKRTASPSSINPRFTKTPKHNENDTTRPKRNKFLTTSLNPNSGATKFPVNQVPSPIKEKQRVPLKDENKTSGKMSLDSSSIPPLRKKSVMLPRPEAPKPKQKIMLSMNHPKKSSTTANSTTPSKPSTNTPTTLNSLGASKHRLELPKNNDSTKKRPLGGNAVALPEAARPRHLTKTRETHREESTIPKSETKAQLKTPKKNSEFNLFNNSKTPADDPFLPDIDTDDEDNASKRLLKTWAATPELRKLILKNNNVDPKSIFGEVPKLRIEDIFKTEASRLRGNAPSPVRYNSEMRKYRQEPRPTNNGV